MKAVTDINSYRLAVAIVALLLALSTPVVLADDHGFTNTYNYVQVHALQAEYADIPAFSLRGAEVRAGFNVGQMFGEFRYRDTVDKPGASQLDEDRWNISLGYAFRSRNRTHFDLRLNYGELDLDGRSPGGNLVAGIDYFGVSGFVHHQLSEKWRVYAGLEQQNWQGWSTQKAYHLGTMYQLGWAVLGAEYIKYSDSDSISMFLRYEF